MANPPYQPRSRRPVIIDDLLDEIDASGLTDQEVLKLAGCSANVLTYIRSGDRTPSIHTLTKLARAVNCIPRLISMEAPNGKEQP